MIYALFLIRCIENRAYAIRPCIYDYLTDEYEQAEIPYGDFDPPGLHHIPIQK